MPEPAAESVHLAELDPDTGATTNAGSGVPARRDGDTFRCPAAALHFPPRHSRRYRVMDAAGRWYDVNKVERDGDEFVFSSAPAKPAADPDRV